MKRTWILVSATALLIVGLILHFTVGGMFSAGDFTLNYFAAGDFACGVFAAGKFAVGIFSAGIFSFGIFGIGIFNIAVYATGLFLWGWKKNYCNLQGKTE
jgi:hypothetical protein